MSVRRKARGNRGDLGKRVAGSVGGRAFCRVRREGCGFDYSPSRGETKSHIYQPRNLGPSYRYIWGKRRAGGGGGGGGGGSELPLYTSISSPPFRSGISRT